MKHNKAIQKASLGIVSVRLYKYSMH